MGAIDRITKALLKGAPGGPHPGGIHVYHSSPHDFDKFDWSKLRTGEGANVYGSGFYFAENPAVSGKYGQYWHNFQNRFEGTPEGWAAGRLRSEGDPAKALKAAADDRDYWKETLAALPEHSPERAYIAKMFANRQQEYDLIARGDIVGPRTYEVDIKARPELMLDWDKPMSQQDPAVRALAARVGMDPRDYDVTKGAALYRKAGDYFGPKQATSDFDKAASEGMRDYGIPGIRYLDQGSRQKAEDIRHAMETLDLEKRIRPHAETIHSSWQDEVSRLKADPLSYNYVVTDPSKLDILAKYGVVGTAGGGLGVLAAQDQYAEPQP